MMRPEARSRKEEVRSRKSEARDMERLPEILTSLFPLLPPYPPRVRRNSTSDSNEIPQAVLRPS